jgi:hypothetical protein
MAGPEPDGAAEPPNLERLVASRAAEYLQLWQRAATKFSTSSYRSADLLDDWFNWYGMAVRDATAAAALLWSASGYGTRRPGRDSTVDRPRDE